MVRTQHLHCRGPRFNPRLGDFSGGPVAKLHAPNAGGPGLIPGQGTRSHMHAATKSSHAATKDPTCHN